MVLLNNVRQSREEKEGRHITLLNNGRGPVSLWLLTAASWGCFRKAVSPVSQKGIHATERMEGQRSSMEVTCDCNLFQGQFLVREKGRSLPPGMFFLCLSRRLCYTILLAPAAAAVSLEQRRVFKNILLC